jgi:hypothetical protein
MENQKKDYEIETIARYDCPSSNKAANRRVAE